MKKLITIILLLASVITFAQTRVIKDANGNYTAISASKDSSRSSAKATGNTFTDKSGKSYPVMISARGKLFYNKTSRNGNVYKVYLKV